MVKLNRLRATGSRVVFEVLVNNFLIGYISKAPLIGKEWTAHYGTFDHVGYFLKPQAAIQAVIDSCNPS